LRGSVRHQEYVDPGGENFKSSNEGRGGLKKRQRKNAKDEHTKEKVLPPDSRRIARTAKMGLLEVGKEYSKERKQQKPFLGYTGEGSRFLERFGGRKKKKKIITKHPEGENTGGVSYKIPTGPRRLGTPTQRILQTKGRQEK